MGYKPKLRFKEFTEGWEEKELGDISEITMGQSPSSKYYTENHDDTILIQGNADLICGNVVPRIFTTEITKKSDPNDIIMTVRAPVGDLAINKFKACIGRGVCAIKSHFFIYFFLQHFKLENKWVKYSQGSTIDAVSSKDIKNLKIRIPSIKEQEKIAKFLSKVDEKIAILESKHQLWNSYKKGIMQQIFSQKLRFKDEKGNSYSDWEKKRLGEVGVIITGNTPSTKNKNNFANGKYIWVTPTDIGNSRIISNTERLLSEEGLKNGRIVPKNSVLVTCIASIGKNCIIEENGSCNQQINAITPNSNFDLNFIYYLVEKNVEKLKRLAGITATPILNKTSFEKIMFCFPILEEQQKIADFLIAIDEKIDHIFIELKETKKFKKGLIAKMFC